MKVLPLARKASLVVKEVDDETLIYDLETDKAHCLNSTAARVWKSCDGQTGVDEISRQLSAEAKAPVDENFVWIALDQLEQFKLLQTRLTRPPQIAGVSRRQAVRTFGFAAALAIPVVTSIIVPTAAHAQSGGNIGDCCQVRSDCLDIEGYECSSVGNDPPGPGGCNKICTCHTC